MNDVARGLANTPLSSLSFYFPFLGQMVQKIYRSIAVIHNILAWEGLFSKTAQHKFTSSSLAPLVGVLGLNESNEPSEGLRESLQSIKDRLIMSP